jgi:hypothetical protein
MITFGTSRIHWNYFLALERDLEAVSRYIEFSSDNMKVYSIALTHILLSASSEVDVILKQLCALINSSRTAENINHYRKIVQENIPAFSSEEIEMPRYGLSLKPWDNWISGKNPDWWGGYNRIKHQRDLHYQEANLENVIRAMGGLLIALLYYYQRAFEKESGNLV